MQMLAVYGNVCMISVQTLSLSVSTTCTLWFCHCLFLL